MKCHLNCKELSNLCLELALFLGAGADQSAALCLLAEDEDSPEQKDCYLAMARAMDEGASLSSAMEQAGCFPRDLWMLLAAGEKTGRTEETLSSLARCYDAKDRRERYMRRALMNPSILLLVMLAVIFVLLTKILPIFNDVYASLGGQMTGIAEGFLRLGMMLDHMLPVLCVLLAALTAVMLALVLSAPLREAVFAIFRKKSAPSLYDRARFARALAMGMSCGFSAEEAVETASALLTGHAQTAKACDDCLTLLREGTPLSEALRECRLIPPAECRLLSLGIKSGSGEAAAEEIASRLELDAEEQIERRVAAIEPVMVVSASLLIGLILICVMLPLTQIMSAIG